MNNSVKTVNEYCVKLVEFLIHCSEYIFVIYNPAALGSITKDEYGPRSGKSENCHTAIIDGQV